MLIFTKNKMTATTKSGKTATRSTKNSYVAAIVGIKNGKLIICSAHNTIEAAKDTFSKIGKTFINQNFRDAADFEIVTNEAPSSDGWEPLPYNHADDVERYPKLLEKPAGTLGGRVII